VGAELQTELASDIARLQASLARAAAATEIALAEHRLACADDGPRPALGERQELCRQLAALRERVALAECRNEGPRALRAELATLLFFARTLRADADSWRSALEGQIEELKRQRAAARQEQDRLAAERGRLVRRRDTLQSTILQTAARIAENRGECRRTVPVFSLGEGLNVCSVTVSCPRRGFRCGGHWLVTLDRSHDVLVRRE
jgi:chromosome segregation ATPase